jgi:hypothetical protein
MIRLSRLVCLSVSALTLSALSAGCSTTQQTAGTPTSATAAWAQGEDIYVDIHGGSIREGNFAQALQVTMGSDPANVGVTFKPFVSTSNANGSAASTSAAQDQIDNDLVLQANPNGTADSSRFTGGGTGVIVEVSEKAGAQTSLSASIDLVLPSGFNGRLFVHTDSGDVLVSAAYSGYTSIVVDAEGKIDVTYGGGATPSAIGFLGTTSNGPIIVTGATGAVNVSSGLGDVEVDLGAANAAGTAGSIKAAQGDVLFNVPAASVIAIQATSGTDASVIYPTTLPTGWTAETTASLASVTLVGNSGSNGEAWTIDSSGFSSDKVQINVN